MSDAARYVKSAIQLPWLLLVATGSYVVARIRRSPGIRFADFGRGVGFRMLVRHVRRGVAYLLTPVNITRYWEFEFMLDNFPTHFEQYLDVSSPRLGPLLVAHRSPECSVRMINIDEHDLSETRLVAAALRVTNVKIEYEDALDLDGDRYDVITSISVIEHVQNDGDGAAIAAMYSALRPGGRLIVTVPVDRCFWNEYRDRDYYGNQPSSKHGPKFFQRYYDAEAIEKRLISAVGVTPLVIRWFGELSAGTFERYEREWMERGHRVTVKDPAIIASRWSEFAKWSDMPGRGICGLAFEKPRSLDFVDSTAPVVDN